MSSLDYLDLCRLCLVKDRVSVPIFEGEGDVRQIFLKIAACLPVKVAREDKLPKKICNDCVYKVELFYQFWNTTVNAEKQLLQWLGEVSLEDKQGYVTNVLNPSIMKQEQSTENRLDGNVMQQVGEHQNNMGMGMIDNMGLGIPMMISSANQQQITSVPMDTSSNSVQAVQAVPGPSSQTTHNQISQNQTNTTQQEDEEESSEDEDNSDDECDGDEGLPVKEESEEDPSNRTIEPTTFVNVSLACDEAGPSGLQQQKISDLPEMPIPQPADGDPKSGKSTITETYTAKNSMQQVIVCRRLIAPSSSKTDSVTLDMKLIPVVKRYANSKNRPEIVKNGDVVPNKIVLINDTNSLTNVSSGNVINPALIPNKMSVNNDILLNTLNNTLSCNIIGNINNVGSVVGPCNNNIPLKAAENQGMDSLKQILVPLKKPVPNQIKKNTLTPVETTDNSKRNVIKTSLSPICGIDGSLPCDVTNVSKSESNSRNESSNSNNTSKQLEGKKVENNKVLMYDKYATPRMQGQKTEDAPIIVLLTGNEVPRMEDKKEDAREKEKEEVAEARNSSDADQPKEEVDELMQNLKNSCPICQKVLKTEKLMQRHVRGIHQKTFCCDKCNKRYATKQGLQEHQRAHEDNFYLECTICHLRYKRKAGLKYHHIRMHSNVEPKYMCDYCGKRYKLKFELGLHIEKTHLNPTHICEICGKVVKNMSYHERQHEWAARKARKQYRCDLCTKAFTTRNNLDNHLLLHKDGFKCHHCGEVFSSPHSLGHHKTKMHKSGTPCTICKKMFYNNSNLYQHVLTHEGIRPYRCDICGEDFTQRSSVVRHRKTHPGQLPPYTETITIANLAKHVMQRHK